MANLSTLCDKQPKQLFAHSPEESQTSGSSQIALVIDLADA